MAPQSPATSLVVSKLGIEATASGDKVKGLLCLKISVPWEGTRSRHVLINGPEHYSQHPIILPLPLYTEDAKGPETITAVTLLALPTTTRPAPRPATAPYVEVSGGQVSIAMDSQRTVRSRNPIDPQRPPPTSRQDWAVILPFELRVTSLSSGASHISLPLSKCLDNVLRFQITSDDPVAPLGEVSIITEPKILPMPSSSFDSPLKSNGTNGTPRGKLTEWSNANATGESDSENGGDPEGSWLQGRFQSAEALSLAWSIAGPPSASSSLTVAPQWHPRRPTIRLRFESSVPTLDQVIPIEAVLPVGWGWSSLSIRGDDLVRWRSVDGDSWDEAVSLESPDMVAPSMSHGSRALGFESDQEDDLDLDHIEDSFTTLRNRAQSRKNLTTKTYLPTPPASSSSRAPRSSAMPPTPISTSNASLLRQTMPKELERMDDFSFEMNSMDDESRSTRQDTPRRLTDHTSFGRPGPSTPRITPPSSDTSRRVALDSSRRFSTGKLSTEKLFDVEFSHTGIGCRTIILDGTLVPLPLTLVSPVLSVSLPFIRIDHPEAATTSLVRCPLADFSAHEHVDKSSETGIECDTSEHSIGSLKWPTDGRPLSPPIHPIRGHVKVVLQRSDAMANLLRMSLSIPIDRAIQEVGLHLPLTEGVRVMRASVAGSDVPRAVARSIVDGQAASEIKVGTKGRSGALEIGIEVSHDIWDRDAVTLPLPILEGDGEMAVDLRGDWHVSREAFSGNFNADPMDKLRFVFPLSTIPRLYLASSVTSKGESPAAHSRSSSKSLGPWRSRMLFSWTTLLNLLLLWLVLSMGQQIQRLRSELAFVVDETRDLRLYALRPEQSPIDSQDAGTNESMEVLGDARPEGRDDLVDVQTDKMSSAVGRVVFGDSAWQAWTSHPTLQSVGRGVEWIWRAVVWLLAPG